MSRKLVAEAVRTVAPLHVNRHLLEVRRAIAGTKTSADEPMRLRRRLFEVFFGWNSEWTAGTDTCWPGSAQVVASSPQLWYLEQPAWRACEAWLAHISLLRADFHGPLTTLQRSHLRCALHWTRLQQMGCPCGRRLLHNTGGSTTPLPVPLAIKRQRSRPATWCTGTPMLHGNRRHWRPRLSHGEDPQKRSASVSISGAQAPPVPQRPCRLCSFCATC